jgi:hypothetical protein
MHDVPWTSQVDTGRESRASPAGRHGRRRCDQVNAGDTLQRKRPAAPAVATIGLVTTTSFTSNRWSIPSVIQLEKQKAEARPACLEAQALELERRRRRLERGELAPFGG